MNDVLADEPAWNHEALRIDFIQAQKFLREVADGVLDVDPLLGFVDVDVAKAVRLHDGKLLVFAFAEMRVDHHRAVVAGGNQSWPRAVLLLWSDHAFRP